MRFALIGDGTIAKYHRKAIEHVGGELRDANIIDPKYMKNSSLGDENLLYSQHGITYTDMSAFLTGSPPWFPRFDYVVICSPSDLHRQQIKAILEICPTTKIICEKPAFLPWEPIVDSDQINICLQLQYAKELPLKADKVVIQAVRDEAYFQSWKGDPKKTGGIFYNIFIHYIYMAHKLGADFEGRIITEGVQERYIFVKDKPIIDIKEINIQDCYNTMYEDIINGGGIKPRDLFYLDWILKRNSEIFGYGKNGLNRTIKIGHELL